jgi:hypothetical protein
MTDIAVAHEDACLSELSRKSARRAQLTVRMLHPVHAGCVGARITRLLRLRQQRCDTLLVVRACERRGLTAYSETDHICRESSWQLLMF